MVLSLIYLPVSDLYLLHASSVRLPVMTDGTVASYIYKTSAAVKLRRHRCQKIFPLVLKPFSINLERISSD